MPLYAAVNVGGGLWAQTQVIFTSYSFYGGIALYGNTLAAANTNYYGTL